GKEALAKMSRVETEELLLQQADAAYEQREKELGSESLRVVERLVMLRAVDVHWVEHLTAMENMRMGIGLEAIGQRDPLVMYKRQGAEMFMETQEHIARDIIRAIYHVQLQPAVQQQSAQQPAPQRQQAAAAPARQAARSPVGVGAAPRPSGPMAVRKVGRNDACPCGSGKKYKKCHGT
ncbi:MAG: SEC-C metal-binding domain-containing protein, partial [Chloroflexota bacterium]